MGQSSARRGWVLTAVAGYAKPPLAELGATALLHRGVAPIVLVLTVCADDSHASRRLT
jgi:hypothetical protein